MLAIRRTVLGLLGLLLAASTAQAQSLEGDWNIRSARLHGREVPGAVLQAMRLNLSQATFSAISQNLNSTGSYTVVPGNTNQITFKIEGGADSGRELRGIYQFVGQDLQIAYSESAAFPNGFSSTVQNRYLLVTYTKGAVTAGGVAAGGVQPSAPPGQGAGGGSGSTGLAGPDD